jgi:hypothetical protein
MADLLRFCVIGRCRSEKFSGRELPVLNHVGASMMPTVQNLLILTNMTLRPDKIRAQLIGQKGQVG